MKVFLAQNKHAILLLALFFVAEAIVNPFRNFPLNDDWAYAKAVITFSKTAEFNFGDFPAMTLATHVLWGFVFSKLIGFSFIALRLSTLISCLVGLFFLNKLVINITNNKLFGLLACIAILFNPMYFNLTNTYMTDVNFNTLTILSCYFIYSYFKTKRAVYLIPIFLFSSLTVLLRQYGIVIPLCFAFASVFVKEKRMKYILISVLIAIGVIVLFKLYENYLHRILPKNSLYKFSANVNPMSANFWNVFLSSFETRYLTILLHVLFFIFPVAIIFLREMLKDIKTSAIAIVCIVGTILSVIMFWNETFPFQNILGNMNVGPETFYQSTRHASSLTFGRVVIALKFIFSAISIWVIIFMILKLARTRRLKFLNDPFIIFLITLFAGYIFMILITESYFDRYHIPLITLGIILFSFCARVYKIHYKYALIPFVLFFYVSVFGTKDYFEWNEKRWQAYYYLRNELKIEREKISGGFEVNCWNEGQYYDWLALSYIDKFDYLIQFDPEKNFVLFKEYEFKRYFPFKKDKILILIRDEKTRNNY